MLGLCAIESNGSVRFFTDAIPESGREALQATVSLYQRVGFREPWISYVAVRSRKAVGMCGFKSPPVDGAVEIAYFTFPEFEGQGVATAMAEALVALSRESGPGLRVTAQTLPEASASTRILEKLGFRRAGTAHDEDVGLVWAWELSTGSSSGGGP